MAAEAPGGAVTAGGKPTGGAKPTVEAAAKPVGGIRLGLSALWAAVVNFFRRLFGGGSADADRSKSSKT